MSVVVLLGAEPVSSPVIDSAFWKTWGDGQAELAAYDLTYPRYGQLRQGVAVTIFVSETFSNQLRVKADPGKHPASDEFPVMKLNLIEDFQTGIYDYNEMTSAFIALAAVNGRPGGYPTKVSSSQQEWCGHEFQQLLFDKSAIRMESFSYFDGEGDRKRQLSYPGNAISEDALLLWARGMAAPVLKAGESRDVPILPSLQSARHGHAPLDWKQATLSRSSGGDLFTVRIQGGPTKKFYVDKKEPHAILKWESSDGEHAELIRSTRLKYWQLNHAGNESYLKQLGLMPRPRRTT